jgi:hypothetical protein
MEAIWRRSFCGQAKMAGICTRECAKDGEPMDVCCAAFESTTRRLEAAKNVKSPYGLMTWLVRDEFAEVREQFSEAQCSEPKPRTNVLGEPIQTKDPFQAFADQL